MTLKIPSRGCKFLKKWKAHWTIFFRYEICFWKLLWPILFQMDIEHVFDLLSFTSAVNYFKHLISAQNNIVRPKLKLDCASAKV